MLPFEPESMESAQARYPKAVAEVVDPLNMQKTPGQDRKHVFDFDDGVRLIVSRDLIDYPRLHLSASAMEGSEVYRLIQCGAMDKSSFCLLAKLRFRQLSCHSGFLGLAGFSEGKGIPHWFSGGTLAFNGKMVH